MIFFTLLAAGLAVASLAYLVYALLKPERFYRTGRPRRWLFVAQLATLILLLGLLLSPARRLHGATSTRRSKDLRVERGIYRLIGVDSGRRTELAGLPPRRARLLGLGVLFLYVLQRLQAVLPYSLGLPAVPRGARRSTPRSRS